MADPKPVSAGKRTASHSVRTTDALWLKAKRRATFEGVTMNHVISEFLEGYANGRINLPTVVKTYGPKAGGDR